MQTIRQATLPLVLLGCAWAVPAAADQAAGSPGLEGLRRIHDPEARASLLLDLVESCPLAHCPHNPETLLEEAEAASELIEDPARRAALLLRLARRHLDANVNLFFDQLTSLNTDTFSADNNDEDKSLLSTTLTGAGFNLGRGKDPRSFQELQLGVGARYRYDEINFERVRDHVDPVLGIVYRSRQIPLWLGFWDQTLALVSPPGDLSDVSMWSSTGLSFPSVRVGIGSISL
ncbi:hypothetical protein KBY96_12040 [Cyanobium sp. ATX 6A2]|uniref:hypothetical protein n=1 Tax=Cyanobium sp. ATX 6A2 TaxID=2823700 RepID=UPI0020CB9241|nr:hypothetical protein [Cyanobium sp. ATX 6A2]MCP9888652.1 hypothetical protein [Cyanobium sp. ATX 6A2]